MDNSSGTFCDAQRTMTRMFCVTLYGSASSFVVHVLLCSYSQQPSQRTTAHKAERKQKILHTTVAFLLRRKELVSDKIMKPLQLLHSVQKKVPPYLATIFLPLTFVKCQPFLKSFTNRLSRKFLAKL